MGYDMMDGMMSVFPGVFFVAFAAVLGLILVQVVRSAQTWHHNNQSPRLTVPAAVVAKRTEVSGGTPGGVNGGGVHASTWYYVTFEVRSGDRMELSVAGKEYGMLAEGDIGMLTFQGTRYLSFERR